MKSYELQQLQDDVGIPEPELDASRIFFRQDAVLEALEGKRQRHARGNGVHGVPVAELVGFGYRLYVPHKQVGTERGSGLVLGSSEPWVYAVPATFAHQLAPDGAREAAVPALQDGILERLEGYAAETVEGSSLEVPRGQYAGGLQRLDVPADRTPLGEKPLDGMLHESLCEERRKLPYLG